MFLNSPFLLYFDEALSWLGLVLTGLMNLLKPLRPANVPGLHLLHSNSLESGNSGYGASDDKGVDIVGTFVCIHNLKVH